MWKAGRSPTSWRSPGIPGFTGGSGRKTVFCGLAGRLPPNAWQRRSRGIGSKGFRVHDWALVNAGAAHHQYMIRRSTGTGELACYHCCNPRGESFGQLVQVAGARWPIEECFGASKGEAGLDHYQVRLHDPWHRHITLAMLAHTFPAVLAHQANKGPRHLRATSSA